MALRIEEIDSQSFVLIREEPVLIGTFPDREIAEQVKRLLEGAPTEPAVEAETAPVTASAPAEAVCEVNIDGIIDGLRKGVPGLGGELPEPRPQVVAESPAQDVIEKAFAHPGGVAAYVWTEDELQAAFSRLEAGEKVKDIANDVGKPWERLRGKWAAHQRAKHTAPVQQAPAPKPPVHDLPAVVQPTSPLAVMKTAITELQEQPACTLCGRHFTMTPDALDLCTRCRHDA